MQPRWDEVMSRGVEECSCVTVGVRKLRRGMGSPPLTLHSSSPSNYDHSTYSSNHYRALRKKKRIYKLGSVIVDVKNCETCCRGKC